MGLRAGTLLQVFRLSQGAKWALRARVQRVGESRKGSKATCRLRVAAPRMPCDNYNTEVGKKGEKRRQKRTEEGEGERKKRGRGGSAGRVRELKTTA